jgi:hypothetical protein
MRGRRFEENDFEALPVESDYVSPFSVQPAYEAPMPMDGAYSLPPAVLAQLADLGITPEEVAQYVAEVAPMAAEPAAASPLAVQAPEPQYVEPVAASPLAVQTPAAAQYVEPVAAPVASEIPQRLNRRFEDDFAALPAESNYVSPLAVQAPAVAQYVEPVAAPSPLAVQPAAAQYVEPDQAVRADDSRMPGPEAVSPFAVQPAAVEAQAASPLAVQPVSPEVNPAEVSPLAVQGPAAAQPDLSQFQNFNPLDGADFSGAFGGSGSASSLQSAPTSFAFPENYGNPKNKIYNLTANPDDAVRLKLVDGTTIFEGQGPEAAAKAAEIVQKLGKEFGTQSTWILDKKPAGGDWAQVSQDTVGEKKKTALNSFLDVAAPIAGALLAVVPGVGLLAAPGLLGGAGAGLGLSTATAGALGAGAGSLLNSGLQNQNSAEAFKKAAIAAGTTFLGAKVGDALSGGISASSVDPTSAVGIRNLASKGLSPEQILQQGLKLDPLMKLADVTGALATSAGTSAVGGAADLIVKGLTTGAGTAGAVVGGATGAGLAGAGGLASGTSGVTNAATNTQSGLDAAADDAATNTVQVAGTGTPVDTNVGLEIAGGLGGNGITSGVNTDFKVDTGKNDAELEVEAQELQEPKDLRVAGPVTQASLNDALINGLPDLTVTASPTTQVKTEPLQAPDAKLDPLTAGLNGLLGEPTVKTPAQKAQDWVKANPLEAAALGLSLFGGAASGGSGTSGSGVNTLSYAPGKQPGTPGSLGSIFSSKLPAATGSALAVTPRDMGQRDWLRYGMGPEASFFSNVPQQPAKMAKGGFAVRGAGTGRSDDIPAVLSDGEYVMDAETVAMLGDGSNKAGAEKLDQLRVNLRRHKGANLAKGRFSVNAKSPEKYLTGGRV